MEAIIKPSPRYQRMQTLNKSKQGHYLKRPLMREDLKVIQYQSQEADNTFITSDGYHRTTLRGSGQ